MKQIHRASDVALMEPEMLCKFVNKNSNEYLLIKTGCKIRRVYCMNMLHLRAPLHGALIAVFILVNWEDVGEFYSI